MLVMRIAQVLRRRWPIVTAGLIATVGLLFATTRLVPAETTITSTVLLLPPSVTSSESNQRSNPYLELGGLAPPTEVLARAINDPAVQERVLPPGSSTAYVAQKDPTTSAPVLLITVEDRSLSQARRVRDVLLDQVPVVLADLQTTVGVPRTSQLTASVVAAEGLPEQNHKTMIRALLVVAGMSLGVTIALAGAVDSLLTRRKKASAAVERTQ